MSETEDKSQYSVIVMPLDGPPSTVSKQQLSAFKEWFLENIERRVIALTQLIRKDRAHANWEPDRSLGSLLGLEDWFENMVEKRKVSAAEQSMRTTGTFLDTYAEDWELTEKTYSVAFDLGVYFGECRIASEPEAKWTQVLGSRRNASFGHMLVQGPDGPPFDPIRAMISTSRMVASGEPSELDEFFRRFVPSGEPLSIR